MCGREILQELAIYLHVIKPQNETNYYCRRKGIVNKKIVANKFAFRFTIHFGHGHKKGFSVNTKLAFAYIKASIFLTAFFH